MTGSMVAGRDSIMHDRRGANETNVGNTIYLAILLRTCNFILYGFGIFGRMNTKGASAHNARRGLEVWRWRFWV